MRNALLDPRFMFMPHGQRFGQPNELPVEPWNPIPFEGGMPPQPKPMWNPIPFEGMPTLPKGPQGPFFFTTAIPAAAEKRFSRFTPVWHEHETEILGEMQ